MYSFLFSVVPVTTCVLFLDAKWLLCFVTFPINIRIIIYNQSINIMEVKYGNGKTEYGKGVDINLSGEEVAMAIYTYLTAHNVHVRGAATITVNGELCEEGRMYVDPSGYVIADGKKWDGREGSTTNKHQTVGDQLKKCLITRYNQNIPEAPFKTTPIDSIEVYEPEDDKGGVIFADRMISACREKGYMFKFYTMCSKDEYDYEIVVY